MSDDMVTFLRARLANDEQEIAEHPDGQDDFLDGFAAEKETNYPCMPYLRISKARGLAEVAALRAVVDAYVEAVAWDARPKNRDVPAGECQGLRTALRHIAAIWAAHPDYRTEWAA